jgi:hypothetical protein
VSDDTQARAAEIARGLTKDAATVLVVWTNWPSNSSEYPNFDGETAALAELMRAGCIASEITEYDGERFEAFYALPFGRAVARALKDASHAD